MPRLNTPGTVVGNRTITGGNGGGVVTVGAVGLSVHAAMVATESRTTSAGRFSILQAIVSSICPPALFPVVWDLMSAFRSRVRLVALAWLLCQVASLSAFMPEDCCARHTAVAAAKHHADTTPACHEVAEAPAPEPEPGAACPMHHDAGAACPMHRSPTGNCCGMSNGCDGPNRPLANLFSFIGVIDAPVSGLSAPLSTPVVLDRPSRLLCRLVSPDAPPPKA